MVSFTSFALNEGIKDIKITGVYSNAVILGVKDGAFWMDLEAWDFSGDEFSDVGRLLTRHPSNQVLDAAPLDCLGCRFRTRLSPNS